MILALYGEDRAGEAMSVEKIRRTVDELRRHSEKGEIIVFDVADAVVGYAIVIHFWSNEYGGNIATVDELYVKPSWRRRGIGTAFLDHLSRREGFPAKGLQLEVTATNEKALSYYTRQGFVPAKNRHLFKKIE